MFNKIWHWFGVLYRPFLLGMVIGVLWSNQIILNKTQTAADAAADAAEQAEATTEQLRRFTEAVAGAVDDIKDNQEEQTKLIICLLATHGANITITPVDEDKCRALVFEARKKPTQPEPQTQQNNTSQKGSGESPKPKEPKQSEEPEQPDNDGVIVDLPLLPKVHIPSPL